MWYLPMSCMGLATAKLIDISPEPALQYLPITCTGPAMVNFIEMSSLLAKPGAHWHWCRCVGQCHRICIELGVCCGTLRREDVTVRDSGFRNSEQCQCQSDVNLPASANEGAACTVRAVHTGHQGIFGPDLRRNLWELTTGACAIPLLVPKKGQNTVTLAKKTPAGSKNGVLKATKFEITNVKLQTADCLPWQQWLPPTRV